MTAPSPAPTQDPLGLHGTHARQYAQDPVAPAGHQPLYPPPPVEPPQQAAAAALAAGTAQRDAITARGVRITLRDGRTLDMRYGMAGVVALEETFGSLQGVSEAFRSIDAGGAVFTSILGLVGAGLVHHGIDRAALLRDDLLVLSRIEEYAAAAVTAFSQAFPQDNQGEAAGQPANP